ncbi:MAG TPA: FliH/SctL family protein [Acidimicrobiales bacterium]|nr:FliH/SctL family protein [Acidimicrobiales bacterium]
MTTSTDPFAPTSMEPTTTLPSSIDMDALLPELNSPQERYDHGYKRGYLAGYAEGARQAQAERAADLATQKNAWTATQARASALLGQLGSAAEQYVAQYGPREAAMTEEVIAAAFELAATVVGNELRSRPERAVEVAKALLADLPTGPAIVRVNPADEAMMAEAATALAATRRDSLVVRADPAVGLGGCIVTSGATTVDARVERALLRARAAFCEPNEDPDASPYQTAAGYGPPSLGGEQ